MALWVLLGGILGPGAVTTARAEENTAFSIEAQILPSDKETYDIRLTVENLGADWEGTVRLMVDEDYRRPSAYDTVISLAQGSKKQFVVKVPIDSVSSTDGTVQVTLLDKKSHKIAEKEFKRLLSEEMKSLPIGILSDDYPALTYLDMGGEAVYFYYSDGGRPIKLEELNQDNLEEMLDSLTFLVIDKYNTGVLTQEELEAIESWNNDGGVLIVGTGAYAEDTLSGFENGYLGVSCKETDAPEDVSKNDLESNVSQMTMANFESNISQMTLANLEGMNLGQPNYYTGAWTWSVGEGSVSVLPYALTELGQMKSDFYEDSTQERFVGNLLEEAGSWANSRFSSSTDRYRNFSSSVQRMLGVLGNSNNALHFGILKALVVGYVILVGPVCYLVLRILKKRELYWVAVPVMAFAGIGLVFLAGRGFEVVNTRVYSVTVAELAGKGDRETYLYCYDASHREWDLRMAEGYEYAGALSNYGPDSEEYYYHMRTEGDTLYVGVKPSSNFEDSYFYVSGSGGKSEEGELAAENIVPDWVGVEGTVTNGTGRDMAYFAVIVNETVYVYKELPAGGTCNLGESAMLYESSVDDMYYGRYLYDLLQDTARSGERQKTAALSALGVGIDSAYRRLDPGAVLVIGVTKDWEKTVDDNCNEISYGCLYTVR